MHIGHKKVHLMLIAQPPSDTLILSYFHFQISIYHFTSVIAFFSKIQSSRDSDFAWTHTKEENVMSKIKASFLSGQLETHVHTVLFPVKGKVGHMGQGFGAYWSSSSIPETMIGLKSHKMQNQIMWPQEIWAEDSESGESQIQALMEALLEELWWTWSLTVPLSSSSPRGWAQPFTSAQAGSCCSLKSLPKVKHPP